MQVGVPSMKAELMEPMRRRASSRLLDVMAEERFFLVRVADQSLSRDHWTPVEIEVMTDHCWWSVEELTSTSEAVFPETLVTILASIDQADTLAP